MNNIISSRIKNSIDVKNKILNDKFLLESIDKSVNEVYNAFKNGKKVFFCGNGGSAADAQHLAAEFSGRFYLDRDPLPSEALHCNSSYMTAVSNDYGYDHVYSRMINAFCTEGDILVAISTSGNSPNIINAIEAAKIIGVKTISFTGKSGGKLKHISNCCICVPSEDTPRIQECHILIGHIICEIVENKLFKNE